jgi:hypothetical protein
MPVRKKTVTTTTSAAPRRKRGAPMPPTPDEIAARAYFLFLERGSTHGRDQDDWLMAERELSAATGSSAI